MSNVNNEVKLIAIHHSQTDYDHVKNINKAHKKRGFRPYINASGFKVHFGYHVWINAWGFETYCRPTSVAGQHCRGINGISIGICIEGDKDILNPAVLKTLLRIVRYYMKRFNLTADKVMGHGECDAKKLSCPGFDMDWFRGLL